MPTPAALVRDVMTRAVVSAHQDALFKEIAAAMIRNRISLVPVLGDGRRVVGVVSAADLLARVSGDHGEIPRGHRLAARHEQHRKVTAATAGQLMTTPAITVAADLTTREAARRCARFHVRCMPVLDESGELAGVVSRGDLLKPYLREDAEILSEITRHIVPVRLLLDPDDLAIEVSEGVVSVAGELSRRSEVAELLDMIGALDGVVAVRQRLSFRTDDVVGTIEHPLY
jgi:CBS domain-containing protein